MELGWSWGEAVTAPYRVTRVPDYPDPTIRVVDGERRIGPFRLEGRQYDQLEKAARRAAQEILTTRIIPDRSHRFACPPLVQRGEREKR